VGIVFDLLSRCSLVFRSSCVVFCMDNAIPIKMHELCVFLRKAACSHCTCIVSVRSGFDENNSAIVHIHHLRIRLHRTAFVQIIQLRDSTRACPSQWNRVHSHLGMSHGVLIPNLQSCRIKPISRSSVSASTPSFPTSAASATASASLCPVHTPPWCLFRNTVTSPSYNSYCIFRGRS
jgi:hypothetical protein